MKSELVKYTSDTSHEYTNDYIKYNYIRFYDFLVKFDEYKEQINTSFINYNLIFNRVRKVDTFILIDFDKTKIIDILRFSSVSFDLFNKRNMYLGLDYLTKWDMLEQFTSVNGNLSKHHQVFPYFFSRVLMNAYIDKFSIIELRCPIGNIYEWRDYKKIKPAGLHRPAYEYFKDDKKHFNVDYNRISQLDYHYEMMYNIWKTVNYYLSNLEKNEAIICETTIDDESKDTSKMQTEILKKINGFSEIYDKEIYLEPLH